MVADGAEFTVGSWWHHGWILGNIYKGKTILLFIGCTCNSPPPVSPSSYFCCPLFFLLQRKQSQTTSITPNMLRCLQNGFFGCLAVFLVISLRDTACYRWMCVQLCDLRVTSVTFSAPPTPPTLLVFFFLTLFLPSCPHSRPHILLLLISFCLHVLPTLTAATQCSLCVDMFSWLRQRRHKGAQGPECVYSVCVGVIIFVSALFFFFLLEEN